MEAIAGLERLGARARLCPSGSIKNKWPFTRITERIEPTMRLQQSRSRLALLLPPKQKRRRCDLMISLTISVPPGCQQIRRIRRTSPSPGRAVNFGAAAVLILSPVPKLCGSSGAFPRSDRIEAPPCEAAFCGQGRLLLFQEHDRNSRRKKTRVRRGSGGGFFNDQALWDARCTYQRISKAFVPLEDS